MKRETNGWNETEEITMNVDEIVRALKDVVVGSNLKYKIWLDGHFAKQVFDLIESLQAQLAQKTEEAEHWHVLRLDADRIREGLMGKESRLISENMRLEAQLAAVTLDRDTAYEEMNRLKSELAEKTALLDATIAGQETLQRAWAESRRRERATVADIEKMMMICEKGSCHFCADGDCAETPYCSPKWRGPQEAGKGDSDGQIR